MCTSI
ncbi:hypothetical protein F383_15030 [Gossypium arboreum]